MDVPGREVAERGGRRRSGNASCRPRRRGASPSPAGASPPPPITIVARPPAISFSVSSAVAMRAGCASQ
jgi:hypothetical protein